LEIPKFQFYSGDVLDSSQINLINAGRSLYSVVVINQPKKSNNNGHKHKWASTSISMSAISDIRHRHLLFRYRRQICRTKKRHSDIGSVPISTSEFITISDIEEKENSPCRFGPAPLGMVSEHHNITLL
jgi:hypothetical protein